MAELNPRPYQLDLCKRALESNTIIYLRTGAGKTLIAAMVIKKLRADVELPFSAGGKRTIFVVNTTPLVDQQTNYLRKHTGLKCQGYTGKTINDSSSKAEWTKQFIQNQVLVMVADVFFHVLSSNFISLSQVNLIVFDECHHAVKDHPMRRSMKLFNFFPEHQQPKVLGLTATLLNSNVKNNKIDDRIHDLERTFHAKIVQVEVDINPDSGKKIREKHVHYDEPLESPATIGAMNSILSWLKDELKEQSSPESSPQFQSKTKIQKYIGLVEDMIEHVKQMGLYAGKQAISLQIDHIKKIQSNSQDSSTKDVLQFILEQAYEIKKIISSSITRPRDRNTKIQNLLYSTDKIRTLFDVIKNYYHHSNYEDNENFCCIIFVKRRFTARLLYEIMKKISETISKYKFIKPDYVLGASSDGLKNYVEGSCSISQWNRQALNRFRAGETNILLATDVADEGVDIPNCSLVIRYDPPSNYRAYVQSKGRARHQTSEFIVLTTENDVKIHDNFETWKEIEQTLDDVIGDPDQRVPQHIVENLYATEIEAYVVKDRYGHDTILVDSSAVQLVQRYCRSLDPSSPSSPSYTLHKVATRKGNKECYYVSLQLPAGSKLKGPVHGDAMSSIILAKRSAAMKTCIALHKMGELSDALLPIDPAALAVLDNDSWKIKLRNRNNKTKSPDKSRRYELVHPEVFYSAYPSTDNVVYLHVIEMELVESVDDSRESRFFTMLNSKSGFGILGSKTIPALPSFPLDTPSGKFRINIHSPRKIYLTTSDLQVLKEFHWLVFNDMLQVIQDFCAFDRKNLDNSFLVVPVDRHWRINWGLVEEREEIVTLSSRTEGVLDENSRRTGKLLIKIARPLFKTMRDFDWQIVTRDGPDEVGSQRVYLVKDVCHEMTPLSLRPGSEGENYRKYFKKKWGVEASDVYQPMLRVVPMKILNNFIRENEETEEDEEYLIPELCKIILFPALYWFKAQSLPLLLHRVTRLLIADDLRREIVSVTGRGKLDVKKWPAMISPEEEHELIIQKIISHDKGKEIKSTNAREQELNVTSQILTEDVDIDNFDGYLKRLVMSSGNLTHFGEVNLRNEEIIKAKLSGLGYSKRLDCPAPILNALNISPTDLGRVGPSPADIMSALTTEDANECVNLERLETLGDSVLKFIVSFYLLEKYKDDSAGTLSIRKCEFISNDNLYKCGNNKQIPGRLKVRPFSASTNFITPSYCVHRKFQKIILREDISENILDEIMLAGNEKYSGKLLLSRYQLLRNKIENGPKNAGKKSKLDLFIGRPVINDKFIADSVEALVGIYLQKMGLEGAADLVEWFGILRADPNVILSDPMIRPNNIYPAEYVSKMNFVENAIGYQFKCPEYLLQALTHSSGKNKLLTEDYQRLEFIGDAIIDFLITLYVFDYCGTFGPGELSDLRSALVNNIFLACLVVKYGLHTSLFHCTPGLQEKIDEFVNFQAQRNHQIDDDLLVVFEENPGLNVAEHLDVPKVLSDIFESIIGAIYIDCGRNLNKVWQVLYGLMKQEIDEFNDNVPKQSVRIIHEITSANPNFKEAEFFKENLKVKVIVPLEISEGDCLKVFYGIGATQGLARTAAAKLALRFLEKKSTN